MPQTRVLLALLLQSLGSANPAPALLATVLDETTSALRVQGQTAYVTSARGAASAAALEQQALSLLLFMRAGATHQLIPKLAAYVASPPSRGPLLYFVTRPSDRDQGIVAVALSAYDKARGSSTPDVRLLADAAGLTVLEVSSRADWPEA